MAIDNTPPRLRLIGTIAVIVVITLVSLDFVFKSYYAFMTDEAQREKLAPTTDKTEQRAAEAAALSRREDADRSGDGADRQGHAQRARRAEALRGHGRDDRLEQAAEAVAASAVGRRRHAGGMMVRRSPMRGDGGATSAGEQWRDDRPPTEARLLRRR